MVLGELAQVVRLSFLVFLLLCVSLAFAVDEDSKKIEENVLIQTEFTPCSDELPIDNSWKQGKWTEEEQADYTVTFYKTCFSIPEVESVCFHFVTF